jgi:hypothetical protein
MQPAIHQEKNPDIYRFDVRLFVAMYCGLHFLFIIPRESPCITHGIPYIPRLWYFRTLLMLTAFRLLIMTSSINFLNDNPHF